ncbi:MAG: hypothetical protein U5R06_23415 [candidate division KSB1 bacterium]|nr:hypothetical protein [candidate division KSB1 bacterium]
MKTACIELNLIWDRLTPQLEHAAAVGVFDGCVKRRLKTRLFGKWFCSCRSLLSFALAGLRTTLTGDEPRRPAFAP